MTILQILKDWRLQRHARLARLAIKKKNWASKVTPKMFKYMRNAGLIILLLTGIARAETINVEKLATAIYYAEGGAKTHFPYGIKSIPTYGNKEYARKICINTIRNNIKRFAKQNKYTDFLEFLGSRYCPITIKSEYYLNKNWVSNVRRLYYKQLALSSKRE